MLKVERQNVIERELNKQGFVLVPALSEMFRCSEETIRRDLKEMESMGRLVRTHGGAYLMEKYDKSYPTNLRKSYYLNTKERLAQRAMQYISDNDVIMMDSSTTCLTLAELLAKSQKPLTIITNSHQICNVCNESNTNINLICLGGTFRKRTSSFADAHTAELIRSYHAEQCFISCPKVTREYGLSDNNLNEARVRENMLKNSQARYLIVDHTKFDASANILFEGLNQIDVIITDRRLDPEWEEYAAAAKIKLDYCIE